MDYEQPSELRPCLQVLYAALDMDDSLGDVRRQLAYEEIDIDDLGMTVQNGGGLFAMMSNLYRGCEDSYDTPGYHKTPSDSECVHGFRTVSLCPTGLSLKNCCWLWSDSYLKLYIIVKHCFQPIIKRHTTKRHVAKQLDKQQQEQLMGIAGADSAAAAAGAGEDGGDEIDDVPDAGPLERWLFAEDRRYLWVWTINALSDFLHRR